MSSPRRPQENRREPFDPSRMRAGSLFEQSERSDTPARGGTDDSPVSDAQHGRDARATEDKPARADKSKEQPQRLSVSQLADLIDATLKQNMPAKVRVVGEVTGFRDRTHWYFSLKDEHAVVNCVMFASSARRAAVRPADGHEVLAAGRVEHYARQGRTQLYVERLEPIGAGALELKFRALCEQLRREGFFDAERKRALPTFPRRVAIVTSKTGAAVQDVINTFRRRAPFVRLSIMDVKVQGAEAAPAVARAIRWLSNNASRLKIDAIIVTRGGGSMEDLWAFNEREVAEAVRDSSAPIVAAIGHETDTTVAELVADERASTPTQAAMRLSPDREALLEQTDQSASRLASTMRRLIQHEGQRLRAAARHRLFTDPAALAQQRAEALSHHRRRLDSAVRSQIGDRRLRLERLSGRLARRRPEAVYAARRALVQELQGRLRAAMEARAARFDSEDASRRLRRAWSIAARFHRNRLESLSRQLEASSPRNVLRRGYSATLREDGALVRSPTDVRDGEVIETRVFDGSFRSIVGDQPPAQPQRRRTDRSEDDDNTLFDPNGS